MAYYKPISLILVSIDFIQQLYFQSQLHSLISFCSLAAEQEPTRSEIDPSPTPSSRIISEGHIDITYRPYQAAVAHYYQYIVCGAAIISQSWVLTAKKCVQFIHQEDIQIVVGATSLRPELEYGSIREVYSIECHSYANIAAVQLRYSLEFSDKIQNIYLCYDCGHPTVGTEATVSGYGALMINNYNVGVLRSVKVQIVDHFDCKKTYDDIGLVVSIQEICAVVFEGDTDYGPESFYRRDGPCLVRHLQSQRVLFHKNYSNQFYF